MTAQDAEPFAFVGGAAGLVLVSIGGLAGLLGHRTKLTSKMPS